MTNHRGGELSRGLAEKKGEVRSLGVSTVFRIVFRKPTIKLAPLVNKQGTDED
jgi:hypothetical protein